MPGVHEFNQHTHLSDDSGNALAYASERALGGACNRKAFEKYYKRYQWSPEAAINKYVNTPDHVHPAYSTKTNLNWTK